MDALEQVSGELREYVLSLSLQEMARDRPGVERVATVLRVDFEVIFLSLWMNPSCHSWTQIPSSPHPQPSICSFHEHHPSQELPEKCFLHSHSRFPVHHSVQAWLPMALEVEVEPVRASFVLSLKLSAEWLGFVFLGFLVLVGCYFCAGGLRMLCNTLYAPGQCSNQSR